MDKDFKPNNLDIKYQEQQLTWVFEEDVAEAAFNKLVEWGVPIESLAKALISRVGDAFFDPALSVSLSSRVPGLSQEMLSQCRENDNLPSEFIYDVTNALRSNPQKRIT